MSAMTRNNNQYAYVNGGTLDCQVYGTDPGGSNFLGFWNGRGIQFWSNGGTVLWAKDYLLAVGPCWHRAKNTSGMAYYIVGQPNYVNGSWDPASFDVNTGYSDSGPFDVFSGLWLGPSTIAPYVGAGTDCRRLGDGDLTIIITNGASVALDWAYMTNGNLYIKGHPGGNSAVAEREGITTGDTTRNVGRFIIRGPHRNTQWASYLYGFYMNQPYGMHFYDFF